jgi:hypothetical protein
MPPPRRTWSATRVRASTPATISTCCYGDVPTATIRSPHAALFDADPNDLRPLPAFHLKVVVEVVAPGSRKADNLDKMAEYADAGIPFVWLVWLSGDHVLSIDVHVLDHILATTACTGRCPQSRKPAPSTSPSESRSTGTASPTWFASSLACHGGSSQRSAVVPGAPEHGSGVPES